jgi:hypothetical protein
MVCPNKNHPSYKLLSQYFTEAEVYQIFIDNEYSLPDVSVANELVRSKTRPEPAIPVTEIERRFNLRNEDGSRKRFLKTKYTTTLKKVQELNKNNPEFQFTIIEVMGEKGDFRTYNSIKADYKKNNETSKFSKIPKNITEIQDFEGTIIEYVEHIGVHKDGRQIGARNINKGEKIQVVLSEMKKKFEEKTWTNLVNSEPLSQDEFSSFEELMMFMYLHEKAHEYIFQEEGETTKAYETRINNEALRRLNSEFRTESQQQSLYPKPTTSQQQSAIEAFLEKENAFVKELGVGGTDQVVQHIFNSVVSRLESESYDDIMTGTKADFVFKRNRMMALGEKANLEGEKKQAFDRGIERFDAVINNWGLIEKLVKSQLDLVKGLAKVEEGIDNEVKGETWDKESYEIDPKSKVSPKLKIFLSGIKRPNDNAISTAKARYINSMVEKGKSLEDAQKLAESKTDNQLFEMLEERDKYAKTWFGEAELIPFNEVYKSIMAELAGVDESIESVINTLKNTYNDNLWAKQVVDKLMQTDRQTRTQFAVETPKHQLDMRYAQISKKRKKIAGKDVEFYQTYIRKSNQNEIGDMLHDMWQNDFIYTDLLKPEGNDYKFDKKAIEAIESRYEKAIQDKDNSPATVKELYNVVGIDLADKTITNLIKGKNPFEGFKYVLDYLIDNADKAYYEDNVQPLNQTAIKALARQDAKNNAIKSFAPDNFRTQSKQIYAYTAKNYLNDRIKELKDGETGDLKRTWFSKNSELLKLLDTENNSELAVRFRENLVTIEDIDLQTIKDLQATLKFGDQRFTRIDEIAQETAALAYFVNSNTRYKNGNRIARYVFPTFSDKTRSAVVPLPAKKYESVDSAIDEVYNRVVMPEVLRIANYFATNGEAANSNEYAFGGKFFYFFPELNSTVHNNELIINAIKTQVTTLGRTVEDIEQFGLLEGLDEAIKAAVRTNVNKQIEAKLETWKEYEFVSDKLIQFDINYLEQLMGTQVTDKNLDEAIRKFAVDYKINDIIAKAEMQFLFIGDPAMMSKKSKDFQEVSDKIDNNDPSVRVYNYINETYTNIGKRLALEIATGKKTANNKTDIYYQLMMKDPVVHSSTLGYLSYVLDGKVFDLQKYESLTKEAKKEYVEKFPNAKNFLDIEGADAQEYTTVKEYFDNLIDLGQSGLTKEEVSQAIAIENKDNPTDAEIAKLQEIIIKTVKQPQKPVYSGQVFDAQTSSMRIVYVKSSAFPLSKHLTKDFQIDNLRVVLETLQKDLGKNFRASYSTANKLGAVSQPVAVFDNAGNVKSVEEILTDITRPTRFGNVPYLEMPRRNFRIQQENPVKDKGYIKRGTQETKLLWLNILNNPKVLELYKEYLGEYDKLYKVNQDELYKTLGINPDLPLETQDVNVKALSKLLTEEATERGYPLQDIKGLELVGNQFIMPLMFHASADRYESLLNSIINNRILNIKMPGNSYILGSAEGFKVREIQEYPIPAGTVFTSGFTGELTNSHFIVKETGKIIDKPFESYEEGELEFIPAKILVPSKFKLNDETLNIAEYTIEKDGRLYLDESRIDKEVLKTFGFRIPTSGQMSMASMEIVGFLPDDVGDLIIAPRDFTKQMGSDFDVDKLYTYHYEIEEVDGKVVVKTEEGKKTGVNRIVEIHHEVLSIPSTEVQKQILAPLSFDVAKDQADLIGLGKGNITSMLDDEYQKFKRIGGAAGKAGTGVYSLAVTFHATLQQIAATGTPIQIVETVTNDEGKNVKVPYSLTIAGLNFDGKLGKTEALSKSRYISDVLAQRQNYSVDNEKEQLMFRLNDNKFTFSFNNFMDEAGFDLVKVDNNGTTVEMSLTDFIRSHPTVVDFVKQRNLGKSEAESLEYIAEKYGEATETWRDQVASPVFAQMLFNDVTKNSFTIPPATVFELFLEGKRYGEQMSKAMSAFNTDSAGLGKSLFDNIDKLQKIEELLEGDTFVGLNQMFDNTINGLATKRGLFTSKMFNKIFPYDKFVPLMNDMMVASGKSELTIEDRQTIMSEFKKFIFASQVVQDLTDESNINDLRQEFFFDTFTETGETINESLASYMYNLRRQGLLIQPMFNLMELNRQKNGLPSIIKWNNSARTENDNRYYFDFLSLFTNTNSLPEYNGKPMSYQRLGQFLVAYAYLEGGIQEGSQFIKYVPVEYLVSTGFAKRLRDINFNDPVSFGYEDAFKVQFLQHNPMFVEFKYRPDNVYENISNPNSKDINKLNEFMFDGIEGQSKPQFIRVYNNKSDIENKVVRKKAATQLYMNRSFDENSPYYGQYIKIPVLGMHGMSEFDFDEYGIKKSLVDDYNNNTIIDRAIDTSEVKTKSLSDYGIVNDNFTVKGLLRGLTNSNNPTISLLANHMLETEDFNNVVTGVRQLGAGGAVNYNVQEDKFTILYDKNNLGYYIQEGFTDRLESLLMHELLHLYTLKTLDTPTLAAGVQTKINKLDRLRKLAIEKLLSAEEKQVVEGIQAKIAEYQQSRKPFTLTPQEFNLYGFASVKEFIAEMSNPAFVQRLNIPSGETTLLDRIRKAFAELIQAIMQMTGLNPDSIAVESIATILEIIDVQNPLKATQPVVESQGKPKMAVEIYNNLSIGEGGNVLIDDVDGRKPSTGSDIIIAYRTKGNDFLKAFQEDNAIGNPFNSRGYGLYKTSSVKESVVEFIAWLTGEKHTDKLQEYRQAIVDKMPEMKGNTIMYYTELKEPSHANALDYLINQYFETQGTQPESSVEFTQDDVQNEFYPKQTIPYSETELKSLVQQLIQSGEITFEDENGKPCAEFGGRKAGFTKGTKWKVVKKIEGPSHAKGGVDITIGKDGVSFKNNDGVEIKAQYGLLIPNK